MSTLIVEGIAKSYTDTPVLTDVSLTVPTGAFAAVLGPSGSGKTTLLRLLAGFDRPSRGRIALDSETLDDDDTSVPAHQRRIGYVPQDGLLFPHLTVAENVGFGLPRTSRRGSAVDELLDLIGLRDLAKRRPHELSGGQQQRVAVARALAPKPRLLLLDEPFAALDASLRDACAPRSRSCSPPSAPTVVLVTHDQEEALSLADVVAVLHDGRILQNAEPRVVYEAPETLAVAHFLGAPNLIAARIDGGTATTALGDLAIESPGSIADGEAVVLIRPEQIQLTPARPGNGAARVAAVAYFGHDATSRVVLDTASGRMELTARTRGDHTPAPSDLVDVTVDGPVRAYDLP